jgi:hypothetical protein
MSRGISRTSVPPSRNFIHRSLIAALVLLPTAFAAAVLLSRGAT